MASSGLQSAISPFHNLQHCKWWRPDA